ncbi:MAG: tRNA-dihydrouridine synthase [Firmicutes bacterium]|nr:tRNA-dihydrouridine synthase [Bacillota bacterium]
MNLSNIESAPIAGFTNQAFRRVLIKYGAKTVYTEMVSATAMFYGNKKTLELLAHDKVDGIKNVVQLFGKTPEHFEFAIKSGHLDSFDEININMGCPAPKITKNGEGCALMKSPELAREIIKACVHSTNKPVTAKFRLGFTEPYITAIEFAKMCEQAGASKIIVHGRFASQGYSGVADWNTIKRVVDSVKIPVVANGDIIDETSARKCLETTGANNLMMARATLGAPWKINPTNPTPDVLDVIKYHMDMHIECHGAETFPEIKKQLLYYCNHLENSRDLKLKIAISKSFDEAKQILGIN